jgi:hypothetical protein
MRLIESAPVQRLAAWLDHLSELKRYHRPVTHLNKEGHGYIVYERTLLGNLLWHSFYLRRWLKTDHILVKVVDKPEDKIMLEYKLADLWIGIFWRSDPVYDVSSQEALRNFCNKDFDRVPVKYYLVNTWLCLIPCFPVHIIRRIKNNG